MFHDHCFDAPQEHIDLQVTRLEPSRWHIQPLSSRAEAWLSGHGCAGQGNARCAGAYEVRCANRVVRDARLLSYRVRYVGPLEATYL